jgi:hypothetical protein
MQPVKFIAYDRQDCVIKRVFSMDYSQWWVGIGYFPGEGERNSFQNEETDRHMLMQYIGLNDTQGKEIYRGFIVDVILHGDVTERFIVVYDRKRIRHMLMDERGELCGFDDSIKMTVVGNIYENRELLISNAWKSLTVEDFPPPRVFNPETDEMLATDGADFVTDNTREMHMADLTASIEENLKSFGPELEKYFGSSNIKALANFILKSSIMTGKSAKVYPFPSTVQQEPNPLKLDFQVGDRVIALTNDKGEVPGTITRLYLQKYFPEDKHGDTCLIALDSGGQVGNRLDNLDHLFEVDDYVSVMMGDTRRFGRIELFQEDKDLKCLVAIVNIGDRCVAASIEGDLQHEREQ